MKTKLSFEDWYDQNYDELNILFAETGADRELDFDHERAVQQEYDKYLKQ